MFKKYWKTLLVTSVIILVPAILGILLWNELPDRIAIHFNVAGEPDGWAGKAVAVLGIPLFMLALQFAGLGATGVDPKNKNISDKMMGLILWIIPAVGLLCSCMIYGYALGYEANIAVIVPMFMGLLFAIIGNYLPKCQQSYTLGIKIPWTLDDTENWNATHRFAGVVWTVGGIIIIISSLAGIIWPMIIVSVVMVLAPVIYSYVFFKGKNKEK